MPHYDDRRDGDGIPNYTGMGQEGDQSPTRGSIPLHDAANAATQVFYFGRFTGKSTEYIFVGEVELHDSPFQEVQPDINGNIAVCGFSSLKLITGSAAPDIRKEELTVTELERQKAIKGLSDQQIADRTRKLSQSASGTPRRVSLLQHTEIACCRIRAQTSPRAL